MSAVLVVEDEQHLADGLRFNLEAEGYTVDAVSDGETALSLFFDKRQTYDALVLDVMLPGKDGFTVAAELRAAGLLRAGPDVDCPRTSRRCVARF